MNELITRLKNKEEAALSELMAMYKNKIFNYLYMMTGDREIAEDLTQETFVKVYFKIGSLKTDKLQAWIYAIATNLARGEFRKAKIKRAFSLSEVEAGHPDLTYDPAKNSGIELEQLLSVLPEKYRIAVIMKDLNDFTFEEMANILKKPVNTLKSLVSRGRQKIRVHLALQEGGSRG
jgi:RNA polymerase sigma-70 factor (ECF subfamily)